MDLYNQPQPPMPGHPQMPQAPQPQMPPPQTPSHNQHYDQVQSASKNKLTTISLILTLIIICFWVNGSSIIGLIGLSKIKFIIVFLVIFNIIALASLALGILALRKSKQAEDKCKKLVLATIIASAFVIVSVNLSNIVILRSLF